MKCAIVGTSENELLNLIRDSVLLKILNIIDCMTGGYVENHEEVQSLQADRLGDQTG